MNLSIQTYWRELASGRRTEPADKLVLLFLTPFAWLYSLVLRLRALLYRSSILKTHRLPRPVVSIGNITVGGTGKTPVTAYIARHLLAQGYKVAVLSRGYGGSLEGQSCVVSDGASIMLSARECGDEPYLLASTVAGLMVVIGPDRFAAGQLAMQQLAPDIFLLDDGFQHLRLHRDLNILLQDFSRPLGNGLTLPAGMLREPPTAARRADLILFTRSPKGAATPVTIGAATACLASHTIVDLIPLNGGPPVPFSRCSGQRVLAFAGIADPASFFAALRTEGVNLVQCITFPDHVVYDKERLDKIASGMRESGAELLVTTEKDGVKLRGLAPECANRTMLARLELTIDKPELLHNALLGLLKHQEL
ncbi:MAG: tetraacyldisaccharide 4'-kinase [Geobacteraceae bacterium GWC2_53_11]|nr:MAG: tetraacyldisaccharide 4'-kinase [Geobacteraceae bacterium GWC2_53_11]